MNEIKVGDIASGLKKRVWEPLPSDLALVLALAALASVLTLVMPFAEIPLRGPIGLILVLILPGYALASALFPGNEGPGRLIRGAISLGLSLPTVLLIGLLLSFSPWGLTLGPIVGSLVLITFGLVAAAYIRRVQLPHEERFSPGFDWDLRSFLTYRDPTMPAFMIVVAELLLFEGYVDAGVVVHGMNLIALVISSAFVPGRTHQALMLLPLFRLVNVAVPIFFQLTLYSYALVYAPMFIPIYLILKSGRFSRQEIGIEFRNFWIYLPVAVVIGLFLGWVEYQVIRPEMLIPEVNLKGVIMLSIIMIFFVGLIEEFMFRSVLQTALIDWIGSTKGLLAASLLFGLMHSGYGLYTEMVFVSVAGIVFGLFFIKTKSLSLVSIMHGVTNISLFLLVPMLIG
ncbi:DUF1616 domain-containing protein [Candidatus Methanocrinis natronophilus]|uniref:DUF1616 domain-containing protein n=1 Tax=Candidatus Methanocrinis natronophilus TaxID=3033396 RepID=A0ABT5X934_9EURY|nr:DUF1616 domain-containing protein [Candidatus Methanocrinis natronophilus]MDF0591215.1 DUF1616 domain-containing protein [Candidatus Methanocrinis natronophilus]